jgi:hypothetical protein
MDEPLQTEQVHPRLEYVANWRGLTFAHVGFAGAITFVLACATILLPYVNRLPTWPVLAVGASVLAFMAVVQYRKEPEYFIKMVMKWRAPRRLSPFLAAPGEYEFPLDHVELWED